MKSCSSARSYSPNVFGGGAMLEDMFARDATVARASALHREKIYLVDVRPKARRVYHVYTVFSM